MTRLSARSPSALQGTAGLSLRFTWGQRELRTRETAEVQPHACPRSRTLSLATADETPGAQHFCPLAL